MCAGHGGRRLQADSYGTGGKCSATDLASQSEAINRECCDEPAEDCSGGYPHTCNAGCAALLLPFWRDCRGALGKDSGQFEPAVQLCAAAVGSAGAAGGSSLAEQLSVQCTDGTAVEECIPECNAARHGFELLATIDGTDTKFSCNLAHGLYSWVGAASEGGYLGSDPQAFLSAVLSGAAGYYAVSLEEDAEISTDLAVLFGQNVRISGGGGSSTGWGSGSITVRRDGALALSGVALPGDLTVQGGGNATVSGGSLAFGFSGSIAISSSTTFTMNSQCYQPYTTLSDAYRATSTTGGTSHCDSASGTGVGGGGWYRFGGAGGDALPLQPVSGYHCGTGGSGWLTGWDDGGVAGAWPPVSYAAPGRYPAAEEGVVEMTACFDHDNVNHQCNYHAAVGVLMCDGFLLWRLPYAPSCNSGYCTTASGLGGVPPPPLTSAAFTVNSGPCTLETSGSQVCVGRPSGYTDSETCQITSSSAGTLSSCPIFDTEAGCKCRFLLPCPSFCAIP